MINKNRTSNKQTSKKYFWIYLFSLCQLEKFCLQISFILTAHGFNLGFKIIRMVWYCLPIYHRGKETWFVVQLAICLCSIKMFQFCFEKNQATICVASSNYQQEVRKNLKQKLNCQWFGLYLGTWPNKFCHRLSVLTGKGNNTVLGTLITMNDSKQKC